MVNQTQLQSLFQMPSCQLKPGARGEFGWRVLLQVGGELKGLGGATESQVDRLAVEGVAGALGHGLSGHLFVGECDQCLAAALSAEVVQNENGIWLELRRRRGEGGGQKADGQGLRSAAVRLTEHQGEPASLRMEAPGGDGHYNLVPVRLK